MPLVEITIMEGRTREQKRAMMAEVTDAIVRTLDAPRDIIRICIREIPAEHWAIAGVSVADQRERAAAAKAGEAEGDER
ncbi:MAG: 2-hydroxymuconate tautomerase family protein [Maritimibacter sp.]|nr:2-hydroxymuconate tautomerase family protein [Maritimibacter sp.]